MVGRAIQKALPGGGMRRYQVLAAVLTYFAVGVAYMPLLVTEMKKDKAAKPQDSTAVVAQKGAAVASSAAATRSGAEEPTQEKSGSFLLGIGALIAIAFSLPVMMIFSSGSGILSALIIAIGMRQAWRMSGASTAAITGPFRLGGNAGAASAS
jgi:hypothetical protein